ncbi:hypothetical protein [Nostoc sp. DSM 114167]|jgi:hypothetical protein|uniref:hypothetical protein n=1 Tax=Nostoc sp. DSM 114167 TaxID=3439050 RepID=UPI0040455E69
MQLSLANEQEFIIIDMSDVAILNHNKPFPETKLDDVAGCLKYQGEPKTLEDIDNAILEVWME